MSTKADYVRSQGQTRNHHCHWPGCDKQVPPAMWGDIEALFGHIIGLLLCALSWAIAGIFFK